MKVMVITKSNDNHGALPISRDKTDRYWILDSGCSFTYDL